MRSDLSKVGRSLASSSKRNIFKGYNELSSLYEGEEASYLKEEEIINEISSDMKLLIENLELRDKNETKAQ